MSHRLTGKRAFDAVVSAHHEEILQYLRRVIGQAGDAEDLSQETFLRAYRAFGGLPKGANVRAWLRRVALKPIYPDAPVRIEVGDEPEDLVHLGSGFHDAETGPGGRYRWTAGEAVCHVFLWAAPGSAR